VLAFYFYVLECEAKLRNMPGNKNDARQDSGLICINSDEIEV